MRSCLVVNPIGHLCVAAGRPDEQNMRFRRVKLTAEMTGELTAGVDHQPNTHPVEAHCLPLTQIHASKPEGKSISELQTLHGDRNAPDAQRPPSGKRGSKAYGVSPRRFATSAMLSWRSRTRPVGNSARGCYQKPACGSGGVVTASALVPCERGPASCAGGPKGQGATCPRSPEGPPYATIRCSNTRRHKPAWTRGKRQERPLCATEARAASNRVHRDHFNACEARGAATDTASCSSSSNLRDEEK